ncbi:MAG TPA: DnaJ domain-containing protein [Thermoanaerobaculia bacterium]|nr:DnaJ domain-containing protein [Thermoanaerobaculia bacterium]
MPKDFYSVLGLPRNATEEQIRQRFRELARVRHPDRFQGTDRLRADTEFQELTQAFNVLIDPERRRQHDLELVRPGGAESDPRQLARAYLQRGVKAYKEKSFLEAADNFDRATKADPTSSQTWHHLALACAQQENWLPRAIAAIERACELEPMNPSYHKQAGRILALAGQAERAVIHYRKAIEWGEDDPAIRRALEDLEKPSARRGLFGKVG